MRFTRYKIYKIKVGSNSLEKMNNMDEEITFKSLNLSKKMDDGIGEFAIPVCKHEENIIVGNLSQTYGINLMKFSGNSKKEIPIEEDRANDNEAAEKVTQKNSELENIFPNSLFFILN